MTEREIQRGQLANAVKRLSQKFDEMDEEMSVLRSRQDAIFCAMELAKKRLSEHDSNGEA